MCRWSDHDTRRDMIVPLWAWVALLAAVLVMLLIDLVLHRDAHEIRIKEAAIWSAIWVAVGGRGKNRLRCHQESGAGFVLDDHRLAKAAGKLLAIKSRDDIHAGAGGQRHHDCDRPDRKSTRLNSSHT